VTIPTYQTALALANDPARFSPDAKPPTRWAPPAPFESVDLRPGRVVLIGAPPGAGKTTLVLQMVFDTAARHNLRAVVCNVEMSADVLTDKLLARLGRVDVGAIMNRNLTEAERGRVLSAVATHADALARIAFHTGPPTVSSVYESARLFGDVRLIVLDYIQRFVLAAADDRTRLDRLMSQVRRVADQGLAVLVVSSVSRRAGRSGSTYTGLDMASYRGSAELEFASDSAYLLDANLPHGIATLRQVKSRFGALCDVPLRYTGPYQEFSEGDALDAYDAAPRGKG
jgi:replicative DNA helicase